MKGGQKWPVVVSASPPKIFSTYPLSIHFHISGTDEALSISIFASVRSSMKTLMKRQILKNPEETFITKILHDLHLQSLFNVVMMSPSALKGMFHRDKSPKSYNATQFSIYPGNIIFFIKYSCTAMIDNKILSGCGLKLISCKKRGRTTTIGLKHLSRPWQ